jgi:hypothetical protein
MHEIEQEAAFEQGIVYPVDVLTHERPAAACRTEDLSAGAMPDSWVTVRPFPGLRKVPLQVQLMRAGIRTIGGEPW